MMTLFSEEMRQLTGNDKEIKMLLNTWLANVETEMSEKIHERLKGCFKILGQNNPYNKGFWEQYTYQKPLFLLFLRVFIFSNYII